MARERPQADRIIRRRPPGAADGVYKLIGSRWRATLSAMLAAGIATSASGQEAASDREVEHTHAHRPIEPDSSPILDLSVVYTFDVWSSRRGGLARGTRYLDNLDVTLTLDAERAFGWNGATFFVYGLYNNGESLTDELVGDLQVASNIDAGTRAARLYEAWVEQRLLENRASLRAGLYDLNSEFDTNDSNALFLNSSHGIGPDFSQSGLNGPSIFPVTSLALRADYRLTDNVLVRAAVLDGVPGDPARPRRTAIELGGGDGALLVGEVEYTNERTKVAAGTWRYTAPFDNILASAVSGAMVTEKGNAGVYAFAERKLTGGGKGQPGLSAWGRLGLADTRFNPVGSFVGGGVALTGPFRGRSEDRLGIAIAHARLASRYRDALAVSGIASDRAETNIELTYRASLAPWLTVQPDLQYVINPGADPALRDALVVGTRVEIGF